MFWCVVFSIILASGNHVSCQSACAELDTCEKCIGYASEKCSWCPATNIEGKRCQTESFASTNNKWCSVKPESLVNAEEVIMNVNLSSSIHLSPQRIKVKARPGLTSQFKIKYQVGLDYPLDIYFLMDYSHSMMYHRDKLQEQMRKIKVELNKMSNNIHIGYGSFIEKPALPFVDKTDEHKVSYAFKNNAPLSNNLDNLMKQLKIKKEGFDRERPKAGLDALMQAIVCKQQIGWRDEARRIIALFTDSESHSAGDGRVIGAFKPNDMKCHLDANGMYSSNVSVTLDYPSLGQINKVSKDEDVQIIFVVHPKVMRDYGAISKKIQRSTFVDLSARSLTEIVRDSYKDMLRFPKLGVKAPPNVQIKLDPPCMDQLKSIRCEIKDYKSKEIKVSLMLLKCPEIKTTLQFELRVIGLSDRLIVEVDPLCQCACQAAKETNSTQCSGFGTFMCGICDCNENRSGDTCDCVGNTDQDDEKCRKPKDNYICSNRGDCRCGKCEKCRDKSHGDFCQFTDYDCSWPGGKVCAGHGYCKYGRCQCHPGWTSDDCTCTVDDRLCIDPYSQKVCSGNGVCECGKCKCTHIDSSKDETYAGEFCADCINCAEKRCKSLEVFVECNYNATSNTQNKQLCTEKSDIIFSIVNKTELHDEQYSEYDLCSKLRTDGAHIVFKHKVITNKLYVIIQSDLELSPKAKIWVPILVTVLVTLLVGLITVLTRKFLVDLHDRRAYVQFEKEIKALGLDDNSVGVINDQLYVPPVQEFINPAYGK